MRRRKAQFRLDTTQGQLWEVSEAQALQRADTAPPPRAQFPITCQLCPLSLFAGLPSVVEAGSLTWPSGRLRLGWLAGEPQGAACLHLPGAGITDVHIGSDDHSHVLRLAKQELSWLSCLPRFWFHHHFKPEGEL